MQTQTKPKMYWDQETPMVAYGERCMLILFPKAKKLQIAQIWEGAPNNRKQGKTLVLSEEDMTADMADILTAFLDVVR